jgi:hypothetical protein
MSVHISSGTACKTVQIVYKCRHTILRTWKEKTTFILVAVRVTQPELVTYQQRAVLCFSKLFFGCLGNINVTYMGRTLIRNLFTSSDFLALYLFLLFLLFVFAQYISPISFCPCNEAVSLSSHLFNDFYSCFSSWAWLCPHLSSVSSFFFRLSRFPIFVAVLCSLHVVRSCLLNPSG